MNLKVLSNETFIPHTPGKIVPDLDMHQYHCRPLLLHLYVRLRSTDDNSQLMNLKETLLDFIGETEVVLVLGSDSSKQIVKLPQGISLSDDALAKMRAVAGRENIVLK